MLAKPMLGFLLSLVTFSAVAGVAKTQLPTIELMPNMQAAWAGKQMIYNGVPMSIRTFTIDKTPEEVFRFYEREWKATHVGETVRTGQGDVEVLGFRLDDVYYSVQATAQDGGTSGALVVTGALEDYEHNRETKFPLPGNTQVVTRVEAHDRGKVSETLTVTTERRANALVDELLTTLHTQGWQIHSKTESDDAQAQVYSLQRGRGIMSVDFCRPSIRARNDTTSALDKGITHRTRLRRRRQRGASMIEWVVVTLGLALAVLATQDFVLEKIREHNDEYTWAMSQPS